MASDPGRARRTYGSRTGMVFGLALYALEALQSIALIPFFKLMLGASEASYWVAITTSLGLVALAYSGYYQPLVRNVSAASGEHEDPSVPANWEQSRRSIARVGGALLITSQLIFMAMALGSRAGNEHGIWPALVYFGAMHLRLAASNHFVLLNGMRQVGRDKLLLIVASTANLALMLLLGSVFKNALALASAALIANGILCLTTRVASRRLVDEAPRSAVDVSTPRRREIFGLLLLSLGGYLNLSTDVVISARLLPPESALDYAFWSRLLLTQVAVVGLCAQVRFPFWASPSLPFAAILQEIRKAYGLLLVSGAVLFVLFLVSSYSAFIDHRAKLPVWMFAAMALNAYVCCLTVLVGQAMMVRNCYTFMRPSIAITCCSPLLAVAIGHLVAPQAFVFGYLVANLCLFAVTIKSSREHLQQQ